MTDNTASPFAKKTSRWVKFPNVGDMVEGTIESVSAPKNFNEYNKNPAAPKRLATWSTGKLKEQVVITLKTNLNEGPDENGVPDDGRRNIAVLVFYKAGSMLKEIQDAIAAAQGRDIETGAYLGIRRTEDDPDSANPDNPRHQFQAKYARPQGGGAFNTQQAPQAAPAPQVQQVPPTQSAAPNTQAGGFSGGGQAAWDQQAANLAAEPTPAPIPPVATPPAEAAPAPVDTTTILSMLAAGKSDASIVQTTAAPAETVAQLRTMSGAVATE